MIATTKNICAKGPPHIADRQMGAYSDLEVDLQLAGKIIHTEAELVYCTPIRVNNTFKFLIALTFTTISKEEMKFITLQCIKFKG